ncbi:MAG: acetylxylan esterase [Prevotellaceae bacterium]|jgi:cephalosporin-C deacetylase|nr:acetylxylan esterase [Prevotellaceae bacterium]
MKNITKILSILVIALFSISCTQAQTTIKVAQNNDWVFVSPIVPKIDITAVNNSQNAVKELVTLQIETDKHEKLFVLSQTADILGKDSAKITFEFSLQAGFYRCEVFLANSSVKQFNIGVNPEEIVSKPDYQPDIKEFWDRAKAELALVKPEYKITQIKDTFNNKQRKLYLVKMKSLGGVEVGGFLSVPVKKGKFPADIHYMGYGSKPWQPGGMADRVEFVLSTRNQGLYENTATGNQWICWGLEDIEKYYYRGAFMDLIRAIDFVCSLPSVDTENIFAEGASQGGAFTLAAAALDNRLKAIAPQIPFLSDYPDYFQIVDWPGNWLLDKQKELKMSDEQFYKNLSYFDIKNIVQWITCPVIMGVGLQDDVCPPHTNFSGYNLITTKKEYRIYPNEKHSTGKGWWEAKEEFWGK